MTSLNAPPLDAEGFRQLTAVSRETLERLETYLALLVRWQPRINLVGPATLRDPWRRHVLDSAQLLPLLPESTQTLMDLGSGAGFPGLVMAILGIPEVHLVESDQRKVAFLREVAAATGTRVIFHPARIEAISPLRADVVTARALAPLARLLAYAIPFLGPKGVCLFLKGELAEQELATAARDWAMTVERFASRSDPSGVILRLGAISPR